jgi:2-methylcitrate dehydratase PrpD
MTLAQDLAKFIKNTQYENIPRKIIKITKQQIFSILGAMYAGSTTEAAKILEKTAILELDDGIKEITIIPSGKKTSLREAIMVNEGNAIALDYDDYLFFAHTGVSVVPLALGLAEKFDLSGKDVLTLIIIGNEVAGRVGSSILLGPQNGQLWSYVHLASSSAIASKVLDLDETQIANAFGIAMYISTVAMYRGFMGPMSKYLTTSVPTKMGLEAAYLAKNGFTGALDIFESPLGWCNFTADIPLPSFINCELGTAWVTETIAFKMVPGCAYVSAVADCLDEIFKEVPNLNHQEIEEIRVYGSILMSAMDDLSRPFTNIEELKRANSHVALNFYVPYNIAVMLIDKKLTADQLKLERIIDKDVHELAKKVKTMSDISMTTSTVSLISSLKVRSSADSINITFDPNQMEKLDMSFGARIVIKMKNGREYSSKVPTPRGSPANRVPTETKLKREAKYIGMEDDHINKIISTINDLENISNVKSNLLPLLVENIS